MRTRTGPKSALANKAAAKLVAAVIVFVSVHVADASVAARADAGNPAPQRIVSVNLCTDQLLVDLVSHERIAGISRLAADPVLSAVADRVQGITLLRGMAEEVLAQKPDVVLTTAYSTPEVVALLRRIGVRVEVIDMANDLDGIRQAIRHVARVVGEVERGETLIGDFDHRIAAAAPRDTHRPTALVYQINSLTAAPGGLLDAAFGAAGFQNAARLRHLGPAGQLPLETLIAHPPDLVVLAHDPQRFRTAMADNLRHRAFRNLLTRRWHVKVPMSLWLCGTPAIASAIEELGRVRALLMQAPAQGLGLVPNNGGAGGVPALSQ